MDVVDNLLNGFQWPLPLGIHILAQSPSPWIWAVTNDLLLMERICKSAGMSLPRLGYKDCDFCLIHPVLSFFGLLILMKQTAYWRGPSIREMKTASHQQPARKWTLPVTNHMSELGSTSFPREALSWLQPQMASWLPPVRDPEDPAEWCADSWPNQIVRS